MTPLERALVHINASRRASSESDRVRELLEAWSTLEGGARRRPSPNEIEEILDVALGRPSHKLVVYGTLAPGEENAHILEPLHGDWRDCTAFGTLTLAGRYKVFRPAGSTPIAAKLFHSPNLASEWSRLDRFEGGDYARILIRVTAADGEHVANIYAGSPP